MAQLSIFWSGAGFQRRERQASDDCHQAESGSRIKEHPINDNITHAMQAIIINLYLNINFSSFVK